MDNAEKGTRFSFINNIKFWACFSVIAVHFRLNVQELIKTSEFTTFDSLFFSFNYQLFISCVPLFMITTGFLMLDKVFSKKYLLKVLSIYTLYIICSLLSISIHTYAKGLETSMKDIVVDILNFDLISYSWYAEMYLGFCLFIPILNKIIGSTTKKELEQYILALLVAISIPTLINAMPITKSLIHLPNYWKITYPIIYYFVGCYIRKYDYPKFFSKVQLGFLLGVTMTLGVVINYLSANPQAGADEGGYASLIVVVQSVLMFVFIKEVFNKDTSLTRFLSNLTLPVYLMSYTVDKLIYPFLIPTIVSARGSSYYAPVIVLSVFIISVPLACFADWLNTLLWQKGKEFNVRSSDCLNNKFMKK